jgi:hypothetical protein
LQFFGFKTDTKQKQVLLTGINFYFMVIVRYLCVLIMISTFLFGCKPDHKRSILADQHKDASLSNDSHNLVYEWAEIALEATARDTERNKPRPTVTSRYLALFFVAVFDAWSRYDEKAVPVYLDGVDRRPETERTLRNKEIAVSYAASRMLREYYPADTAVFKAFMTTLGLDYFSTSVDLASPEGIGNLAAEAVIKARRNDGSNQYGDLTGSEGKAYYDTTGYNPVNTADKNVDINRWQPKYFSTGIDTRFAPGCLTPHWGNVKPVALRSSDQFRSPPPPKIGSAQLEAEVKEVVDLQANLTNDQKAIVEFMRDGPASVQQAGHWLKFAMNVSVRDTNTLDEDVKMFMLTEVTAMDAFIACWDTKMHYDFARPHALVHYYYKDKIIKGWGGPGKGWIEMLGQEWRPYSPDEFLCPPFPAYVSGHSTVSGGCAEVLKLFTGDDYFGEEIKWVPGHLTEPDRLGDTVILKLPTFTETANIAGMSRVLGGYHIQADNVEGLALGRKVGNEVWKWYQGRVRE